MQFYVLLTLCLLLLIEGRRMPQPLDDGRSFETLKEWGTGEIAQIRLVRNGDTLEVSTDSLENNKPKARADPMTRALSNDEPKSWDPKCTAQCDADCQSLCTNKRANNEFTNGHCVFTTECTCQCE